MQSLLFVKKPYDDLPEEGKRQYIKHSYEEKINVQLPQGIKQAMVDAVAVITASAYSSGTAATTESV